MVDDVVSVLAALPRHQKWRRIEMADAKLVQVRDESARVLEMEAIVQLQPIGREGNVSIGLGGNPLQARGQLKGLASSGRFQFLAGLSTWTFAGVRLQLDAERDGYAVPCLVRGYWALNQDVPRGQLYLIERGGENRRIGKLFVPAFIRFPGRPENVETSISR